MPRLDSQAIEQLLLDAQGWEQDAERLEKEARRTRPLHVFASPLESGLAAKLLAKCPRRKHVDNLIAEWDRNGDGSVSKGEFRMHLQKMEVPGSLHAIHEIDAIFDRWDDDHSGKVDLYELRKRLFSVHRRAHDNAIIAAREASGVDKPDEYTQAKIDALRSRVRSAKSAAGAVRQISKLEAQLEELRDLIEGSVQVQLGMLLVKRGINVGEVVGAWVGPRGKHEMAHTRELKKSEFVAEIQRLGLTQHRQPVTAAVLGRVFDDIDKDHSGYLDMKEAKSALKEWQSWSNEAKQELQQKMKELTRLRLYATRKIQEARRPIEEDLPLPSQLAGAEGGFVEVPSDDEEEECTPSEAHAAHATAVARLRIRRVRREAEERYAEDSVDTGRLSSSMDSSRYLWESARRSTGRGDGSISPERLW